MKLGICWLFLLLAAAGCAHHDETAESIAARTAEARASLDPPPPVLPVATVSGGIWVGGQSVINPHGDPLPAATLVLNSMGAPLELREIAAEITLQSGLPLFLEEGKAAGPAAAMPVAWNGPLPGLLDSVAAFFGLYWEYRDKTIRLYRAETRTFTLAALPSSSAVKAGVSAGTAPASAGLGVMTQDTTAESTIKIWEDIKNTVTAMIPAGGSVSLSPATGTVTVTAPPPAMRRIARFLDQQNDRITRQVSISVKVLRVELADSLDLGVSLTAALKRAKGGYALGLSGVLPATVANGGSFSAAILPNGSQAVVDALATTGNVSLVTETSVTTLNGQAAPVSVARQRAYVASAATTLAGGASGTTQTQITPGTVVTGFNLQVLPRILDDRTILLQYGLSLSDAPDSFRQVTSGGTTIELPDIHVRSFLQQALLRSGDLLLLAGYQSASDSVTDNGVPGGLPGLALLLGGSAASARRKEIIVILLTPHILARRAEGDGP